MSTDAPRSGIRMYDVKYLTGETHLIVAFVINDEEVLRIPGEYVSRLRALLGKVEGAYPGRTGSAEGVEEIAQEAVFAGGTDPTKVRLN